MGGAAMTTDEFEAKILEAITTEGSLMTLDADNGVEIDTHGPNDGNKSPVEGWYREDGRRSYFAATVTVTLDEFSSDYGDVEDEDEGDDDE